MARKIIKGFSLSLLSLLLFCSVMFVSYRSVIPDSVATLAKEDIPQYPFVSCSATPTDEHTYNLDYKLFGMLPLKSVKADSYAGLKLYPGGMPFGIKFATDGVMIVGFCDVKTKSGAAAQNPASAAGLKINDMIKKVNGMPVTSCAELTKAVEESGGKALTLDYVRDGKTARTTLTPAFSDEEGKYKTGVYVRDGGAGIGTVTFIDPENFSFGGLGHIENGSPFSINFSSKIFQNFFCSAFTSTFINVLL